MSCANSLFFDVLPVTDSAFLSHPVFGEGDLRLLMKGKSLLIIGNSPRVREKLTGTLEILASAASVVNDMFTSTKNAERNRVKIERAPSSVVLLAEEDYGPAFTRLCGLIDRPIRVLLPSGYVLTAFPGASYESRETASLKRPDIVSGIKNKRILIWGDGAAARERLTREMVNKEEKLCAIAYGGSKQDGAESSAQFYPRDRLVEGGFDLILCANPVHSQDIQALFTLPPSGTPLLFESVDGSKYIVSQSDPDTSPLQSLHIPRNGEFFFSKKQYRGLFPSLKEGADTQHEAVRRLSTGKRKGLPSVHSDIDDEDYKVTDGKRRTPENNGASRNAVYIVGSSVAHGYFCKDNETIAAQLQKICNTHLPQHDGIARYTVHNHAVSNSSIGNSYFIVRNHLHLIAGDVVLLICLTRDEVDTIRLIASYCAEQGAHFAFFVIPHLFQLETPGPNERMLLDIYKRYHGYLFEDARKEEYLKKMHIVARKLKANGVPCYMTSEAFSSVQGDMGLFFDILHVTPEGNRHLAAFIFEEYIQRITPLDSERVLRKEAQALIREIRSEVADNAALNQWITAAKADTVSSKGRVGAMVVNCNPFTLGHRHLIETCVKQVDMLYIFLVEEDKSYFSFEDRSIMLLEGVAEWRDAVRVFPSGSFLISSTTFPEYFSKDVMTYLPDLSTEIAIFASVIAPNLGITIRFFGEEPTCAITRAYHEQIKKLLPLCGMEWEEVPRLCDEESAISASRVRALYQQGKLEELSPLVPLTTFKHLLYLFRKKGGK